MVDGVSWVYAASLKALGHMHPEADKGWMHSCLTVYFMINTI